MQIQIQEIQKRLPLIIAVACGILAILLLNIYLQRKETELLEKAKQAKAAKPTEQPQVRLGVILVAQKDIPAQTIITQSDLSLREIPVDYIQPGAAVYMNEVVGQISSVPINTGEQILKTILLPPGKIGKSLSEITPEGKRAITVLVDNTSNIVDLIKPGDHVDILAFIAPPSDTLKTAGEGETSTLRLVPLFQSVEVLAVGGKTVIPPVDTSTTTEKARGLTVTQETVTFALSPQEAVLLSFVQEHGKIKLSLRSSDDVEAEAIKPADWDSLLRYLYPERALDSEGKQPVVEIYRGVTKEVIPLSGIKPETKK